MRLFLVIFNIFFISSCSDYILKNTNRLPSSEQRLVTTAPPTLPSKCIPSGDIPVNPDMCQASPMICGCDKFPHDPRNKPNRKRIQNSDRANFPNKAPNLEHFSSLGYCTGISSGENYSVSASGEEKNNLGTRKYTLRIIHELEPKTQRVFLKIIMDDQADSNDKVRKCNPLSQTEATSGKKSRPVNAPPLFFIEGETAEITVVNDTKESEGNYSTTIHWHGLILPNDQDGVPDITQKPIRPGETKKYKFKIQQNGTYWYHPHDLNEQDTKGAFVILPNPKSEAKTQTEFGGLGVRYHHDRVVMLTDYKERNTLKVLNYLRDEDRNAYETDSRIHKGWLSNLNCAKEYLENFKMMKMFWMDKADVWYDAFFMNDESCLNCDKQSKRLNEFSNIKAGERVRVRLINSSASSYFFIDYANSNSLSPNQKLDMMIVAKDGLPIKPMYVDQLYMGMGETYDVLVEVPEKGTLYELRAKSIDDVNSSRIAKTLIGNNPLQESQTKKIIAARDVPVQICGPYPEIKDQISEVSYSQLEAPDARIKSSSDKLRPFEVYHSEAPIAQYNLSLSGSMEDYHWKISGTHGTKLKTDDMHMLFMDIKEGYRIRVTIENDMVMGMMNHPWHLHGNWFRIINDSDSDEQNAKKALLHTATIFPGQKVTLEFYADPEYRGAWMFHCHNLYHMANDMMMYLKYDTLPDDYMSHSDHMGHNMSHMDHADHSDHPTIDMKNQYGVVGVSSGYGTEGLENSAAFRYRGTLGDNMGMIDFNLDISKTNSANSSNIKIDSKVKYCFEVNKCVFLDLFLHDPGVDAKRDGSVYIGKEYKPFNSDFVVLEAGAGTICSDGSCAPAVKANLKSTIDAGWNTKLTGQIGCEGKFCTEFFAGLDVSVTANPRITVIPLSCKISTNKDETSCMAKIKFITDPLPMGK